ncbi:MAG: phosphate acyltransferase PlsX [Gammaproteobacteria bacterium]|nr:phosphate acyltransferase PlsX [Gammaproteobacteria bacterium]NNJ50535.1 phosphate acyltransferase PlsX [Gammaproteobacteria bacterium]
MATIKKATIALDAMGGDFGPEVVIPAAIHVVKKFRDIHIILVGDEARLHDCAQEHKIDLDKHFEIQHASQVVEMHEDPRHAVRKKKDSSMRVAINMVKEGRAQAAVSAGNTGALMATAKFVLKTVSGIDRPAICTTIPSYGGHTHMLDLGANVDSSAENLFQFAVMGSVLAEAIDNTESPKIGLLNIGSEDGKGNAQVKEADKFLQEGSFNYIGYVEGDDIYSDKVDVVVCDGFVGNVSLKTMEGVAKMIATMMRDEFNRSLLSKLTGLIAWPVLRRFKKRVDPRMYNGASMLGLTGIVIKSHGSADVLSYANAIEIAVLEVEKRVPEHIGEFMEPLMGHAESELAAAEKSAAKQAMMNNSSQEKTQLESQA